MQTYAPADLNGSESVYNQALHLPIPTIQFVLTETGLDLTDAAGGETKANALLRFFSVTMMDAIKENLIQETKQKIEYLIAKTPRYRREFISLVATAVFTTHLAGLDVFNPTGDILDKVSSVTRARAKASDLTTQRWAFTLLQEDIRSDY